MFWIISIMTIMMVVMMLMMMVMMMVIMVVVVVISGEFSVVTELFPGDKRRVICCDRTLSRR